jgi:EAL domain-containing protein (putative c-di-GMP-specific phosphodiesterase class I)
MTKTPQHSPQPVEAAVGAPPLAPDAVPCCFVVDEDTSIRHFLSLVLQGSGIDTVEFASGAAMRENGASRAPNLIFHDVSLDASDAIKSLVSLGARGSRAAVQLMSSRGAAVLDHVNSIGLQNKLTMLPPLKKPFEIEAIVKLVQELKLSEPEVATHIDLAEALTNNWIEFWYQPKIDLRRKQLAGAEAYAHARHPQHGVVLPSAFMKGATEASILQLSQLTIERALNAGVAFSRLGVNLPIAVNIPVDAVVKLPIEDLVKAQHSPAEKWPGLIIDLAEEQIVSNLGLAVELTKKHKHSNVRFAIDDFGRGYASLAGLSELPFAEIKLERSFIADCGTNKINAPLCKMAIDLAHNFGQVAVANGIEKAADVTALVAMGCDYGQGFLLGQPMPQERFVSLLRQRTSRQAQVQPAPRGADKQPAR